MCGRFNVTSDPLNQLIVEITGRGFVVETRLNIAPTEQVPVLVRSQAGEWDVRDMRWWLVPYWSDGPSTRYSMFNAKSETLARSRAFRDPFARRRCIVPATGYYEWRLEGSIKVPYYITPESNKGFALAGLWDRWQRDDEQIESCTIITASAPDAMKVIHDRIPVNLETDAVQTWMNADTDQDTLMRLLGPRPSGARTPVAVTPVSTYVNNARHKDVRVIEPIAESSVIH
ncbi:MAG: SOS response-associated peptidase [Pseudomonadales bacterium]